MFKTMKSEKAAEDFLNSKGKTFSYMTFKTELDCNAMAMEFVNKREYVIFVKVGNAEYKLYLA